MQDSHILDTILTKKHADDIRSFDPVVLVKNLLATLSEREQQVLSLRFGVPQGEQPQTLEQIGNKLKVTRERIRQITKSAILKLKTATNRDDVQRLVTTTEHVLQSYGGALEEDFFVAQLLTYAGVEDRSSERRSAEICLRFILNNILDDYIHRRTGDTILTDLYVLPIVNVEPVLELVKVFMSVIDNAGTPLSSEELLKRFRLTEFYRNNRDQLLAEPLRIAREVEGAGIVGQEEPTVQEEDRVLLAYLASANGVSQNIFNDWGRSRWPTIHPKRMNDKLYLILRNGGKPLHFTDITDKVNEMRFDKKIAKAPSVHNELILDKRFVLVGRGTYALKEWGYHPGTVADVIIELLKEKGPLSREEIVKVVLDRRMVKRQTVHLALLNRNRFRRTMDGKYSLTDTTVNQHST